MRTLILSCNTGEGHNSCATAIKEYFTSQGEECQVKDGLGFFSESFSRFISWGHSYMYRHLPWLFRFGYQYTEKHPAVFQSGSGIYRLMTAKTEELYRYIIENGFDTVICTHVFTALMMTAVLKKYPIPITTCFVATDYTCSPSTKDSCLDWYFIPEKSLMPDFECENISEEKLVESGIPIRQMFFEQCSTKRAKESLNLDPDGKHMLLMCGSMGCGPIRPLVKELMLYRNEKWDITVICGRNQKLKQKLVAQYAETEGIHIKGYVENISLYMDSADLYLTKPGGISVTEAAVKQLPMVLVDAVAGCEDYNRLFFLRNGGAKTGSNVKEVADVCRMLMEDEEKLQKMKTCLEKTENHNAAEVIYRKMKKAVKA